jgi:hypothetical protein
MQSIKAQTVKLAACTVDVAQTSAALAQTHLDLAAAQARIGALGHSLHLGATRELDLQSRLAALEAQAGKASVALIDVQKRLQKADSRMGLLERCHKHQRRRANVFRNQLMREKASGAKTLERLSSDSRKRRLKKLGMYTPRVRSKIALLRAHGVAAKRIPEVIKATAELLDVDLEDNVTNRSIGRMITELGIKANMQIAFEIGQAECDCSPQVCRCTDADANHSSDSLRRRHLYTEHSP